MEEQNIFLASLLATGAIYLFAPKPRTLFKDDYEDDVDIVKTTPDLWAKLMTDAKNGKYWCDAVRWFEVGWINDLGSYTLNESLAQAIVTDKLAHKGLNSVEVAILQNPLAPISVPHSLHNTYTAVLGRYIRNPVLAIHGIWEVGAWFYIPEGYNPHFVHVSIENHLNWQQGLLVKAGINPERNTMVVWMVSKEDGLVTVSKTAIDFQYDTWFKLWMIYNTRIPTYKFGYSSPIEQKIVAATEMVNVGSQGGVWEGLPSFNFYAGAVNLPGKPQQKLYVDDFYVKKV